MRTYQKLGLVLAMGFSAAANASITLYNNLSERIDGSQGIPPGWIANEFSTDNHTYQLDSITLKLSVDFGITSLTNVVMTLYTDGGAVPGTPIGDAFVNPQLPTTVLGNNTFTPNGTIILAPNTQYWVKLDASAPGATNVVWAYTIAGVGGWAYDTLLPGLSMNGTDGPYLMRVDATPLAPAAVPVPAAAWLMGTAILGLTSALRRKKRLNAVL